MSTFTNPIKSRKLVMNVATIQEDDNMPTMRVEMIGPEQAESMLLKNTRNRNIIQRQVRFLSNEMRIGNWKLTNNGIGFDSEGSLIDGQHRLLAVIDAQVTVPMLVCRKMAADTMTVIDKNKVRSLSHDMLMDGRVYSSKMPSCLRVCVVILKGCFTNTASVDIRTIQAFNEWKTAFSDGIDDLVPVIYGHKHSVFVRNAAISGALVFCYKANKPKVLDFITHLTDGTNLERDHQYSPCEIS